MKLKNQYGTDTTSQSSTQNKIECSICNDVEWIIDSVHNRATPCKCREIKQYKRMLESSGISKTFLSKTFDNYTTKLDMQKKAKEAAINFVNNYGSVNDEGGYCIALLGQPGAGKTHLSIAVANELMSRGIGVLYMPYREAIVSLKQCSMDQENYNREIGRYKNASVLLIDDLFKGAVKKAFNGQNVLNPSDANIMFDIINHRYLKQAPIVFSSECRLLDFLEFDEALGSRIMAMCKGYVIEFKGKQFNYRLT